MIWSVSSGGCYVDEAYSASESGRFGLDVSVLGESTMGHKLSVCLATNFGSVYKARWKHSDVAVKIFSKVPVNSSEVAALRLWTR